VVESKQFTAPSLHVHHITILFTIPSIISTSKALEVSVKMMLPGKSSWILWPIFLQIYLLVSFSFSIYGGNETDRLSLPTFKAQITGDPLGKLSSWNESSQFCQWSGVTCGRRHQRVVELDLHSYQLVGSLSPHIGNLSFLRILNLANNSLSLYIPQELGPLFRLEELVLRNNTFDGGIPANISRCANLRILDFSRGNLTGKLPAELGLLSKLQVLTIELNNFVGEIPYSFGNLSAINAIYGSINNLEGSIPNVFGQLKRLKILSLGANILSGMIPRSIFNLSSLTLLSFPVNQLYGSLPHTLGLTLPNLQVFNIHTNQFDGLIPATFSNASNLLSFQIGSNNFNGKVPPLSSSHDLQVLGVGNNNLGKGENNDLNFVYPLANNMTSLEALDTSDNNFGGVLPEIVSNFSTKLMKMTFARNQIRGSIPTQIGNLINLEALGLETNQLTGMIPSSMGKLQRLSDLFLNGNKISGMIPSSMGNMTSLGRVNMRLNNLEGSIPPSLGNWQKLLSLALSQNNLSGPIPKEIVSIPSLSMYLVLSENELTGSLPIEMEKLVNLGYLDVSKNRFSGEIPKSLGSCVSLESLHLEENFLQGPIPNTLSSLRAIQELNLSYNNLTGQIPEFLEDFKLLESLDLSFNDFEGEVPVQGAFQNTSAISIFGNKKLCGGINQLNLTRCPSSEPTNSKSPTKLIWIIGSVCGFLGVILIISFLLFYCFRKKKDKPAASQPSLETSFPRVAYEDLLGATDGFSSANLIGEGSFGSVFKGILGPDKIVVAVKVLNLLRKGASKSFMAECEALKNIRHRNLVKLLTTCSSIDFQGNDFKALVYEFMVNGNLEEWLHPVQTSDEANGPKALDLMHRLNIAIHMASALNYLHHDCQMPIIHCDLKPSNILLDTNMTAHVGDFGLARFHSEASNQTNSVGLKGTIGYAAPGNIHSFSLFTGCEISFLRDRFN